MLGILLAVTCAGLAVLFLLSHQVVWAAALAVVAVILAVATGHHLRVRGDDI